jgi:protein phosphatase
MGATLTALLFLGRRVYLVHAGDSRAYRFRDGRPARLTRDQTYAQELLDRGQLTPEAVGPSGYGSVLVSHIGTRRCAPQVECLDVRPGDWLVLCSDGLTEGLDEAAMAEVLRQAPPEGAARALVERALGRLARDRAAGPCSDNVTAVVVQVPGEPAGGPGLSEEGTMADTSLPDEVFRSL